MIDIKTFHDVEFEYDLKTYYASGSIQLYITVSLGGSYEGYDYESVYDSEIESINLDELYYIDEDVNDAVQVLGKYEYKEVEKIAREVISDKYN